MQHRERKGSRALKRTMNLGQLCESIKETSADCVFFSLIYLFVIIFFNFKAAATCEAIKEGRSNQLTHTHTRVHGKHKHQAC